LHVCMEQDFNTGPLPADVSIRVTITDISTIHTNAKNNGGGNKNGNVILLTPVWEGLSKVLLNTHTHTY